MLEQLSPYIRVAMDSWLGTDTFIERVIWDYELLFLKEGKLEVTVENNVYAGEAGDVFLFKPRQPHTIRVLGGQPARQPHVHFDLTESFDSPDIWVSFKTLEQMSPAESNWFRPDLLSGPDWKLPSRIRLPGLLTFEELLFAIIREFEMKMPFHRIRLKGLMLELLAFLLRETQLEENLREPGHLALLLEIQHYLNLHAGRELILDELSEQFHMNKRYLISLFKQAFQITPMQYHQQMRLDRAKNLLRHSKMTMQQIADSLGYPSIHGFSRAFKNKEGCSPSAYRAILADKPK
ncbi:AraC family transcriptional regulator [Paenibacillus nasutitermitis]|uniref:Msm operon regulatory protein n=1 Tax=Paenibacillus nasutitermitis TaxID=1652958 RepID=A0A916YJ02_9BACL|nr:AraC family transcriptional regulator [Paenibacillus nasutitermitis]GGD46570.1 Msm operon regulatory protein [Paenibacillus nasutitermitis]